MAPHANNTDGGEGSNGDDYRLPNTVYKAPSRAASEHNLITPEGGNAAVQQGGPVQPINGAAINTGPDANAASVSNNLNANMIINGNNVANGNVSHTGSTGRRSVSAPLTTLDRNGVGFVWGGTNQPNRSLSTGPWTEGFSQVMNQRQQQNGRGCIPSPIGTCHAAANIAGTASSTLVDGGIVQNGAASAPLPTADTPTTPSSDAQTLAETVENVVEQQLASALGPLRIIINSLSQSIQATRQENSDFHEQNNILSRQLDLQYQQIQQHSDNANAQIRALLNLIETQTGNIQGNTQNNGQSVSTETNNDLMNQITQMVAATADTNDDLVSQITQMVAATAETNDGLVNQMIQMVAATPRYMSSVMQHLTMTAMLPVQTQALQQSVLQAVQATVQHAIQTTVRLAIQDAVQNTVQNIHDTVQQSVQAAAYEAATTQTRNALEVVVGTQREAFDNVLRFHIQRSIESGSDQTQVGTPDSLNAETFGNYGLGLVDGTAHHENFDDETADTATALDEAQLLDNEKPAKRCGKIKAFFKKVFKFGGN
ncbi:hypothetical protein VFPFJ_06941 [Purpureocillium lilacinum]|uniref:Uncharacterized protein n=1 Tax=Purpureocillium lilacinum TaxID=33203 RepID=A0A179HDL5_PURLI|nr:hypothetical protein VFPFJ_06941 [Purpureocillium lilacinum]OAQ88476.1 hypothetical protein VFPFJ_06941 [Purpureocillium lilacinum]